VQIHCTALNLTLLESEGKSKLKTVISCSTLAEKSSAKGCQARVSQKACSSQRLEYYLDHALVVYLGSVQWQALLAQKVVQAVVLHHATTNPSSLPYFGPPASAAHR